MATYLNSKKSSWVNWNLSNKTESSAALAPGASKTGGWSQSEKFEEKHSSLTLN
jgi:endoglucanase